MPSKRKAAAAGSNNNKNKKVGDEATSCVLYNDTNSEINRAWELNLEYKTGRYGDSCTTNVPVVAAGGHERIELPKEAVEGVLKISKVGLVFQDGTTSAAIVNGAEFRVQLDKTDPPLSKEEAQKASQRILDVLEGASPIPFTVLYTPDRFGNGSRSKGIQKLSPEEREAADNNIWKWIVKGLGREEAAERPESLKKIRKMITDGSCFSSERTRFLDKYQSHPRKPSMKFHLYNESCFDWL